MTFTDIEEELAARAEKCTNLSLNKIVTMLLDDKDANRYPRIFDLNRTIDFVTGKVTLTPLEIELAIYIGPLRTAAARATDLLNRLVGRKRSEAFYEANGLCGEFVYAKHQNLYPFESLAIKPRTTREDYGDFVDCGLNIDAKITEYLNGCMTLANWKPSELLDYLTRVQASCLIIGDCEKSSVFYLRGWITSRELTNRQLSYLPGRKSPQYIARQSELYDFNTMLNHINIENKFVPNVDGNYDG